MTTPIEVITVGEGIAARGAPQDADAFLSAHGLDAAELEISRPEDLEQHRRVTEWRKVGRIRHLFRPVRHAGHRPSSAGEPGTAQN